MREPLKLFFKLQPTLIQKWKPFQKKFADLAATAVFVVLFLHQKQSFLESHFWAEIITLTRTICRGVRNLPHKFYLYLINSNGHKKHKNRADNDNKYK